MSVPVRAARRQAARGHAGMGAATGQGDAARAGGKGARSEDGTLSATWPSLWSESTPAADASEQRGDPEPIAGDSGGRQHDGVLPPFDGKDAGRPPDPYAEAAA